MRLPGVFRITWADPNTMKVEVDNGQQERLFRFGTAAATPAPAAGARGAAPAARNAAPAKTWQGNSVATWLTTGGRGNQTGNMRVVTTGMRAGYYRKNGIPYSEDAVVTEWFYRIADQGVNYMHVITLIQDPLYLNGDWIKSSTFKLLPDGSSFKPTPCTAQ
jgi:hypothetical protein